MKPLPLLLACLALLSYTRPEPYVLSIKQGKYEKADGETILVVPVTLTNNTSDTLKYMSMTCSWQRFYCVEGDSLSIEGISCKRNFPDMEKVLPHSSEKRNLRLRVGQVSSGTTLKFRVGMNLIILKNEEDLPYNDYRQGKVKNIIWSNVVERKGPR